MSEIRVTTVSDTAGTGPVTLTKQSAAKAWLYAPATVASISASFNISSLDDDGTGTAGMNLTSSMSSANYVTEATDQSVNAGGSGNNVLGCSFTSKSSGAMEAVAYYIASSAYVKYEGATYYNVSVHGDLA